MSEKKVGKIRRFMPEIITAIICIAIVVTAKCFIQPVVVVGPSMEPTYKQGNLLFVNRRYSELNRFDVVVVRTDEKMIIKRVIGLPGETVMITENAVYINGEELDDPRAKGTLRAGKLAGSITLGEDEYIVLGDNRNNSFDSRDMGAIEKSDILGNVLKARAPAS